MDADVAVVVTEMAPVDSYRCGFVEESVALLKALCHWGTSFEVPEGHARHSQCLSLSGSQDVALSHCSSTVLPLCSCREDKWLTL